MYIKHPFKVNQVWCSETNPEQDFYIYQLNEYDGETAYNSNEMSYIETAKVNAPAFEKQMSDYFKGKKHDTTYPFCWFGEHKINSLKQKIKKYNMKLINTEEYPVETYKDCGLGDLSATDFDEDKTIWEELKSKYSK
jgi:hypothetical protein